MGAVQSHNTHLQVGWLGWTRATLRVKCVVVKHRDNIICKFLSYYR